MGTSYTDLLLYAGEVIAAIGAVILIRLGWHRLVDWWDEINDNPAPDHEGVTVHNPILVAPLPSRQCRHALADDTTRFYVPQEWIAASKDRAERYGRHSVEYIAEITGTLALPTQQLALVG